MDFDRDRNLLHGAVDTSKLKCEKQNSMQNYQVLEGRQKDMRRKSFTLTSPWIILALLLPLMATVLFIAKPVEAG